MTPPLRCAGIHVGVLGRHCSAVWGGSLAIGAARLASTDANQDAQPEAASSGRAACLTSRTVVWAAGDNVIGFLQGLVTNDMRPLGDAGFRGPVYAAILSPKGKFLHDTFVYRHPANDGSVLLDLDALGREAAMQLLNRYKLKRRITFSHLPDHQVWAYWGAQPSAGPWLADPRLPQLGHRAVVVGVPGGPPPGAGQVISEEAYKELRYQHGVAEGDGEIPSGQAAPLDYNLDQLHGVSYTKGCYVGQERNSFTHYRGVIRRRLMPVLFPRGDGAAIGPGTDVVTSASGERVGQVRGVAGRHGVAYLKLSAALSAAGGQLSLQAAGAGGAGTVEVVPMRPGWWPAEWGHEEGAGEDKLRITTCTPRPRNNHWDNSMLVGAWAD